MNKVRVFDIEKGEVRTMPAQELAPGMVPARVEGIEGEVWVDARQVREFPRHRHARFTGEPLRKIRRIQALLEEVDPLSLEEWVDGFRRDKDPEREIAFWLGVAETYAFLVGNRPYDRARKLDVYNLLMASVISPAEDVPKITELQAFTKEEGRALLDEIQTARRRFFPPDSYPRLLSISKKF